MAATETSTANARTVFMDGVWDLFHVGHLNALRTCMGMGHRVIIGVIGDADCERYKRRPIVAEVDRAAIVAAIRGVDEVVCPCPLVVTDEFLDAHGIDLVVHSFSNAADALKQDAFYAAPRRRGIFREIEYYGGCSTSQLIERAGEQHRATE